MNLIIKNKRTKGILNNIGLSLIGRSISTICTFLIVPITIDYINPTQYGIWLTLSSIIAWVAIFDMGLGQGYRNRFAESMALGNTRLAQEYTSTAYITIGSIVTLIYFFVIISNSFIDWSEILKIQQSYRDELSGVFLIVSLFFCVNMVVSIFSTMLTADQKPGITSILQALGNVLSLLSVFLLTKLTKGSLVNLALYYSSIPCLTIFLCSILSFSLIPRYRQLRPKLSYFRFDLIKNILSLGFQFFLINLCMIAVLQLSNIVISRELGPLEVTSYNISHKYFNLLYIAINIIVNPFWSAFTEAYALKDYDWMKRMVRKLEQVWVGTIAGGFIMLMLAPIAYNIWIGDKVSVEFCLDVSMYIFYVFMLIGNIYMYLINGIGTIRIQLIIYIIFAIISWPVLVYSCRIFGVIGILLSPAALYAFQAILGKIQLRMIMNQTAKGLWVK